MRHDPASGAIVVMLRSLKMHGMAQAVTDLMEQGSPAFEAAIPILSQLLKAETAEREVRSVAYQLKIARFPVYRDLAGFPNVRDDTHGIQRNDRIGAQLLERNDVGAVINDVRWQRVAIAMPCEAHDLRRTETHAMDRTRRQPPGRFDFRAAVLRRHLLPAAANDQRKLPCH